MMMLMDTVCFVLVLVFLFFAAKWFLGGGVGKKLKNIALEQREKAAESLNDDERDGKYDIAEAERDRDKLTTQIAAVKTQTRELRNKRDGFQKKSDNMSAVAEAAAKAQNRDDVAAAIGEKAKADAQVKAMDAQIAANEALEKQTVKLRDELQDSIDTAKNNLDTLVVRKSAAALRTSLAQTAAGISNSSSLSNLRKLQDKVEHSEAEAAAFEDLAATSNAPASLSSKYAVTESHDDEVEAMMARFGSKQ